MMGNWQETVNELAAAQAEIERLKEALEQVTENLRLWGETKKPHHIAYAYDDADTALGGAA
jgi:hypothetical protein